MNKSSCSPMNKPTCIRMNKQSCTPMNEPNCLPINRPVWAPINKPSYVLYSYDHDQLYKHICMRNHNNDTIKMSDTVLTKIYLSLYLKSYVWEGVGDRTELQHIDPPLLWPSAFLSRSQGLLNWRPSSLLGAVCSTHLVSKLVRSPNLLIGGLRAPSAECWLSLPHLLSKLVWSPNFGMACFDHHRAEINVMKFTGHPLPMHQFVTVPWDFNPVPYCQLSSPTPMEYALPPSLEWHVWPGRRSIYNICFFE